MQGLREGLRLADRYVLSRPLGRGGMAESWLADDERAGTAVALKFLLTEYAEDAPYRELFRKEWRLASRLMHPHIARTFEYHDEDAGPFFAMQFIDGDNIGALANEELAIALPPVTLLADALRYAHGKSAVHRDIKAENVLLDARGAPYLLDFGVSAAAGGGTPVATSPTRDPAAPPEPADDIYALGVLLHEIVTGRPPADGVAAQPLTRPNAEPVPTAVEALVRDMLAAAPAQRPSAEAVAERLTVAGFAGGAARRTRRAAAGTAEAAEEIAITKITPAARDRGPAAPSAPAAEREGLSARWVYAAAAVLVVALLAVLFALPRWVENDGAARDSVVLEEPASDTDDAEPEVDAAAAAAAAADAEAAKPATDEALGDLLSQIERLRFRGIERWGGQPYLDALAVYAEGDRAYVDRDFVVAGERYRETLALLQPFFGQIESRFRRAMAAGESAFEREDFVESIRQYDLATAITPNDAAAQSGLERARNLEAVLDLMSQGDQYLDELALEPARLAYEKALELDPAWAPAAEALANVRTRLTQFSFESRMTEGFDALARGDYASARAAFNAAKGIDPNSREPADGLLQLDQEVRLTRIRNMESEALAQESGELWETAVTTYEALLEVDADLQFAQEGLARARGRAALHSQLSAYIDEPDTLSDPATMQRATDTLLGISRMDAVGPRLSDQKDELSRLLKRAATPLTVEILSDNATEVSVYRVGTLGTFESRELSLRPGTYVAVGVRPGYRDVRLEFRVAPELELGPVVVRCEEPI